MKSSHLEIVQPEHFAKPRGYANGIIASGRTLYIAGQIGWEPDGTFVEMALVGQFKRALQNVVDVVVAAGGSPDDLVKMTIFVTEVGSYRQSLKEVGQAWREVMGNHYPSMALVGVTELVEPRALVEIEAIAALSENP